MSIQCQKIIRLMSRIFILHLDRMFIPLPRLITRDICLIAVLTAVCVGGNYALIGLPNIKVMDLIVFAAGFVFGTLIGATTGALTWIVYGTLNPLGSNFPIWLSTMVGETIFGIVGGILGRLEYRNLEDIYNFRFSLEMGLWGLVLTVFYDLLTNIVFAITFKVPMIAAIVTGWFIPPWFGFLHEVSNLLLFFVAVHPLIRAIRKVRGSDETWLSE